MEDRKMKMFILVLTAGVALFAAEQAQTLAGKITDTMCGAKHGMIKGQPDAECVRTCAKTSSSQFALLDGKAVIRLSYQKTPEKFADQPVKVTGTYNEKTKTMKVVSIEAGN